jgi:hypothetical protein
VKQIPPQSPELGFGFCFFYSWNGLFYFFRQLPAVSLGGCCVKVRTLLRSSTGDAAISPALVWATMARFLPLFPPRSASFISQRLGSQSIPNGPKCTGLAACANMGPFLADVHLRFALARVSSSRLQPR